MEAPVSAAALPEPSPEGRPEGAAPDETGLRPEARGGEGPPLALASTGDESESEGPRRRARGRRGGRRRRRSGDRPQGESPAGESPARSEAPEATVSPMDTPALSAASYANDGHGKPDTFPTVSEPTVGIEPLTEASEREAESNRRGRRPRRHENAERVPGKPVLAEPTAPGPEKPPALCETPPRVEPAAPAEPAQSTERQAPRIPVITVGAGNEDQLPKKRGWWKRLTE